jgi:sec-independent protein translocase protein TatA
MFGLGTSELLILAGIVLLLFGAKKLPQLGRSMGSAITNFKKGLNETDPDNKPDNRSEESSKES